MVVQCYRERIVFIEWNAAMLALILMHVGMGVLLGLGRIISWLLLCERGTKLRGSRVRWNYGYKKPATVLFWLEHPPLTYHPASSFTPEASHCLHLD